MKRATISLEDNADYAASNALTLAAPARPTRLQIPHTAVQQLAQTVDRRVTAQVMVMEGQVTMTLGDIDVTFTPEPLQ
jgi:hypothetical protein